jgi:hypothetical protein
MPKGASFLSKSFPLNPIFIALFWYSQEAQPAVFSEFVWKQLRILFTPVGFGSTAMKLPFVSTTYSVARTYSYFLEQHSCSTSMHCVLRQRMSKALAV